MNDVITHTKNKMNTRTFNVISFNDFRKMAKNAIQQQLDNGSLDAVDIMEGMPVLSFDDLRKWNDYWYFIISGGLLVIFGMVLFCLSVDTLYNFSTLIVNPDYLTLKTIIRIFK